LVSVPSVNGSYRGRARTLLHLKEFHPSIIAIIFMYIYKYKEVLSLIKWKDLREAIKQLL